MGLFGLIPLWDISPVTGVAGGYCCCPLGFHDCDDLLRFVGRGAEMADVMDSLPCNVSVALLVY